MQLLTHICSERWPLRRNKCGSALWWIDYVTSTASHFFYLELYTTTELWNEKYAALGTRDYWEAFKYLSSNVNSVGGALDNFHWECVRCIKPALVIQTGSICVICRFDAPATPPVKISRGLHPDGSSIYIYIVYDRKQSMVDGVFMCYSFLQAAKMF